MTNAVMEGTGMDELEIWATAAETGTETNEYEIMDCRMFKLIRKLGSSIITSTFLAP
jgi:hypothetical protein